MGKPAARMNDMHTCPAPMESGTGIHVGGQIVATGSTVLINNLPAATMQDTCICPGSPNMISSGSKSVLINNKMAARIGDKTAHGGQISAGSPNVLIGD